MRPISGVAPEVLTALPRADEGAIAPTVSPLRPQLSQGTFSYEIPLELPFGRGNRRLELALRYEPRTQGNGAFGVGWDLAHLFVERRTDRGVPRYTDGDDFAVSDGARLERVGPDEYRAAPERAFRRIRFLGTHWEITETDGTRCLLGETEAERLFDPARPDRVARWLVSRRVDPNGTIVRYRYARDRTVKRPEGYEAAQVYLRAVEYVNLGEHDFLNAVRFDYHEERPDAWTSFRHGFPVRTGWLCRQIVGITSDIDGGAPRVVDFGGAPVDALASDGLPADRFLPYGLTLSSSSARRAADLEFAVPLSGVTVRLDTAAAAGPAGGRYRVEETFADGSRAARELVTGANALDVPLGNAVTTATITALAGRLVLTSVTLPGARLPAIVSRYRLTYGAIAPEFASLDPANVPPPARLLSSVQRLGYDEAFAEHALPPMRMGYTPLVLAGVFPRALRGTPNEPLGQRTTPLGFFGTGRPDLFQTEAGHRAFLNRGRIGADVVMERRELAQSPSVAIGDAGVFLRDVEGRGAVDLTTTALYYPNPSAAGQVSRSAPEWRPAVNFDPNRRHPALAPAELMRSRAIDLDGDGRIDLLTSAEDFWEWMNQGGGAWSPGWRIPRVPSFGDKRFPDVSLGDAGVFIADMNGDGLDEIVRISARKVEYWSRTSDGWTTLKATMAASPRLADFDPDRVLLADVTGNGSADLVYLHGNGLSISLNAGGNRFSAPIILDFRDYGLARGIPMPSSASAALILDLLGDGTRGLLWSFARQGLEPNYFFLPLAARGKPYLLAWIENGTGGRIEVDYSTSALQSAEDEANGRPWRDEPPYPVVVVSEAREIDLVTGHHVVRRFRYRDGYYDRDERELRGFAEVEERILGNAARRGLLIRHAFASGRPAGNTPSDRARARALAGQEVRTTRLDLASGARLGETVRQVDAELVYAWRAGPNGAFVPAGPLATQPGGELIAFACERFRLEAAYEGTTSPRLALFEQLHTVSSPLGPVLDELGRLVAEISYGEVAAAGAGPVIATLELDGAHVPLRAQSPTRQRRREYEYALNRAAHIGRHRARELTWVGPTFAELLAERRFYFDGGSAPEDHLPLGEVTQGNLQREETLVARVADLEAIAGAETVARLQPAPGAAPGHLVQGTARDGAPALFSVDIRRVFERAGGRIAFGTVLEQVDARGATTVRQYDAASWFLRHEANALGHVTRHDAIDYRAGAPRRTLLPNGSRRDTAFDAFGREIAVTEDAGAVAAPQRLHAYDFGAFARDGSPVSETTRRLIDQTENPLRHVTEIRYLDGLGRLLQSRHSSESHGGDWVARSRAYEAGGPEPSFESLPYWSAGSAFAPIPAGQPGVTRRRDALGRVVEIGFPDGSTARLDRAPWQVTVHDPEDLDPASAVSGTPTVVAYDHGGSPVEVTAIVRHGNGPGSLATVTTRYAYDAEDRLVRVTDGRGSVLELTYDARGDALRVRHPDAGDTVRLYAGDRKRVHERNAAGDAWWTRYDALGRIAHEVRGQDPAAAPELSYAYDAPAPGEIGRLVAAADNVRNHASRYAHDARGNVVQVERVIAGAVVSDDRARYNDLPEVARRDFPSGAALEYAYGLDGRTRSVRFIRPNGAAAMLAEAVAYHSSDRVERATLSAGAVGFVAAYDPQTHRLVSRRYETAAGLLRFALDPIVYDRIGNVRTFREHAPPTAAVTWSLEHDSLYRLRHAVAVRNAAPLADLEYRYDLVGNFTRNDELAPGEGLVYGPAQPDALLGTAANPAQYRYDDGGRVVRTPRHADIRWNARQRVEYLATPGSPDLDLVYDHDGAVVSARRTDAAGATSDLFLSPEHERHAGNDLYFAVLDGSQWVAAREDGARVVLVRALGESVVRVLDGGGAPIAGADELFGPFGAVLEPAAVAWPRGFGGAVRGPGGFYVMGARPYLAGAGRFGAPDPVLLDRFDEDLLFEPRQLTPYLYALGNPHVFRDPGGRLAFVDDAVFWGIGRALGLRGDSFVSGTWQNFSESWAVLGRSIQPFHSGSTTWTWPFRVLQNTWGLPNEILGIVAAVGAVELFGARAQSWEQVQLIQVPGATSSFTLGSKVVGYANPASLKHVKHEQGHFYQNLLLGPTYVFVIGIPSVVHFWTWDPASGVPYDDFYTEKWATAWGK